MSLQENLPFHLGDSVQYQEGAVVSKTLINKPTGSITLFAFDQDETLSEHKTPFEAYIQIVEGETEFTVSGKTHHLKAGQSLLMGPNAPHAVKAVTPFKMLLVLFKEN